MREQNYANHARYVPMFHFVTLGLIMLTLIGSCVNLYKSLGDEHRIYSASLIVAVAVILLFIFWFLRAFAVRLQDRAIRSEENFRYYLLTGNQLDPRLTIRQIVGLRFASDEEFVLLAGRAAEESLSEDAIKRSIRRWKADHYRV